MKKYLLVVFIVLVFSSLAFGQSITLNNIGMYVDATGDQTGEAGETTHVRVDYTTASMVSIAQTHWASTNFLDQVILAWYNNNDPNSGTFLGVSFVATSNFSSEGVGTNKLATFDFTIPTSGIPVNAESFQIGFGLYGINSITWSTFYGTQYTSYIAGLGASATAGNPPANYYEYIDFVLDTTTETPTMTLPADNQHDNNPTDIQFTLPEVAYAGSVKLSFTRSGEDHECTILSEAQGIHSFTINPASLSSASEIELVTGGNSLTANVAYTVTIEYQDVLGNAVASDSNTGYVYDTLTQAPTFDLPATSSVISDEFTIQYDQPETAYEGSVKLTFTNTGGTTDSNSPHILEVLSEVSGTNIQYNLKAANLDGLGGEAYVTSLTGDDDILVDGAIYTISIEYQDLAEHTAASDQNTDIIYNAVVIQASGGDYNVGTSFSPGSTNNAFFRIFLQKDGSGLDPTVDKIEFDLLGDFSASDIENLKIWRSSNSSFEAGSDVLLITETTNIDHFIPDFSPDEEISSTGVYYFLTVDVSATASGADEIGASINTSGWITASTSVAGSFPISGSTHPLPVTLSSFTVVLSGQPVLYWTTQTETNNAYWNIYRSISQNLGQAIQINYGDMIPGQGTVTEPTDYSYIDNFPIVENTTYWYWLECVDNAGEADILGPVSLFVPEGNGNNGTPATPDDYGLKQNYPNPFNPDTKINFALVEDSPVRLTIYNIKGEKIKTIFEDFVPADMVQTAYWNGRDESGKRVASGVYMYRLRTNKTEFNKRMLLMK